MGLKKIEIFHTDPSHVEKIMQAKYGVNQREFPWTMLIAFALGCVVTYLVLTAIASIPQAGEAVYLQGGGLVEALPLALFSLVMAVSLFPLAFPAPFFLLAGVIAVVPAVHWIVTKAVFHTRRAFRKPRVRDARGYRLRQV